MDLNQFAVFGFLAPVILFYQQSRNFFLKILRVFWKSRTIPYDFAYWFYKELDEKSIKFNFDDYDVRQWEPYSLKQKRYLPILFKQYKFELFLYKKFIPILIFGAESDSIKIQYLKFTFDFERFLTKIIKVRHDIYIKEFETKTRGRFCIVEKHGKSLKEKGVSLSRFSGQESKSDSSPAPASVGYTIPLTRAIVSHVPLSIGFDIKDLVWTSPHSEKSKYIFTKQGQYILSQVEKWLDACDWYQEKNIVWRRGMVLNGKPGQGKSALILEIAKKTGIPIHIFDLSSFDNIEFEKEISEMTIESGIVLFEDIDNVFEGRENITRTEQYGGLTFDCFINKLSGVNGIRNKFVFITTNKLEKLDAALLRPGRIDEIIELHGLDMEEKLKMAKIMLENDNLAKQVITDGKDDTTAEFENRVVKIALQNYWSKNIS